MKSLLPWKKFCSCSAQSATKIVGYIYLLVGLVGIVLSPMASSNDNSFDDMSITNNTDDTTDSELDTTEWRTTVHHGSWLIDQFVVSILTFLSAICVLIAAWMNSKRWLLLPWLISQPLFAIIAFISTGYYAVWYWLDRDTTMGIVYSLVCFLIAVIGVICWVVIKNYYTELREPEKNNKENSSTEIQPIIPPSDVRNANNGGNVKVKIDN